MRMLKVLITLFLLVQPAAWALPPGHNLACDYDMRDRMVSYVSPFMAKVVAQLTARREKSECLGIPNRPQSIFDYNKKIGAQCDQACGQLGKEKKDVDLCLNECSRAKSQSNDLANAYFTGLAVCDGTGVITEKKMKDGDAAR